MGNKLDTPLGQNRKPHRAGRRRFGPATVGALAGLCLLIAGSLYTALTPDGIAGGAVDLAAVAQQPRDSAPAAADEEVGGVKFSGQVLQGMDPKALRGLLDEAKQRLGSGVAAIVAVNDGRASVAAAVTDDLTARISAVDLVRAAVAALGGQGGGGRPDMAQGGGPDGDKAEEALAAVRAALESENVG